MTTSAAATATAPAPLHLTIVFRSEDATSHRGEGLLVLASRPAFGPVPAEEEPTWEDAEWQ